MDECKPLVVVPFEPSFPDVASNICRALGTGVPQEDRDPAGRAGIHPEHREAGHEHLDAGH